MVFQWLGKPKQSPPIINQKDALDVWYGDHRLYVASHLLQLNEKEMNNLSDGRELTILRISYDEIIKNTDDLIRKISFGKGYMGKLIAKPFPTVDGYKFAWQYIGNCPIYTIERILPSDASKNSLGFQHGRMFRIMEECDVFLVERGLESENYPKGHPRRHLLSHNYQELRDKLGETVSR